MPASLQTNAVLLPEIMAKVAGMGPASLQAVHRFIHLMELKALAGEIKDDAEQLRLEGRLDPEVLDAAVKEFRLKQG